MNRIQRKRTKGWRMPEGAVYVGRPTIWGNPFSDFGLPLATKLDLYRNAIRGIWSPGPLLGLDVSNATGDDIYGAMKQWADRMGDHPTHMVGAHLQGATALACWCELEAPCHADVLIEIGRERGLWS